MVQLKRKVTLRTKENSEVSAPKTEGKVTQAPGAAPQPSSGGGKWWVVAVVVALLAAGGVYFVRQCGDDRTPSVATAGQNDSVVVDSAPAPASPSGGEAAASEGAGKAAPAANGNAETTAAPAGETSSAQAGGETRSAAAAPATSASTAPASAAAPTKAASTSSAPASASSTSAAPAQAPTGSVEQTAREVMRGVYGNGRVRKDRLAGRYAEVQRRVNQIYRARRAR